MSAKKLSQPNVLAINELYNEEKTTKAKPLPVTVVIFALNLTLNHQKNQQNEIFNQCKNRKHRIDRFRNSLFGYGNR